jgi:hypothetical protein
MGTYCYCENTIEFVKLVCREFEYFEMDKPYTNLSYRNHKVKD